MKDLPHHIKKLNRRVVRSVRRETVEDENFDLSTTPKRKLSKEQVRKQAKAKIRKERETRTPTPLTPDQRNKQMKKRVPIFAWDNKPKPRGTSAKKKTPRM